VIFKLVMNLACPNICNTLVVSDDARLAAQVSCAYAKVCTYLPILDGPRLGRSDAAGEIVRRNNAIARAKVDRIIYVGLSDQSCSAFQQHIPAQLTSRIRDQGEIAQLPGARINFKNPPLVWGKNRLGVGLLKALRSGTTIVFSEENSSCESIESKSGHLVVCEEGDNLAEVIAANYAFAMGAGLHMISNVNRYVPEELLERFYSIYENRNTAVSEALAQLKRELRKLGGDLPVPNGGSITFISDKLPYGFGYPEFPSTHLFRYPDLGLSIVNGLAQEQPGATFTGVAVMVDPDISPAPEIEVATKLLYQKGAFVRGYSGRNADVTSITQMVELFPYDLLVIATHCGDVSGHRWTYEFIDSEGIHRVLVVDIALGIGRPNKEDLYPVMEYFWFHSLDGVDWHDPEKKAKLYIGTAIQDFNERTRGGEDLEPIKKERVSRVPNSAALRMSDHNYIAIPQSLANEGTPIIINNACSSWHRLAGTFAFAGARAYIGALFSIMPSEAYEVSVRLLEKHFEKFLPVALWRAQNEVFGSNVRRPYVMTGVFTQKIHISHHDVPVYLVEAVSKALSFYKKRKVSSEWGTKKNAEIVEFFEAELKYLQNHWFGTTNETLSPPATST
jgi:hypothetical protein